MQNEKAEDRRLREDERLPSYYTLKTCTAWCDLECYYNEHFHKKGRWVFRGQGDKGQGLTSTLDRAYSDFGIPGDQRPTIERGLLRHFQRKSHHYLTRIPEKDDRLEWMALMQHHGAPTRLLDWTYSYFVALYFAVQDMKFDESQGAWLGEIWALNTEWLPNLVERTLRTKHFYITLHAMEADMAVLKTSTFKKLYMREQGIPIVGAVTPQKLNERLIVQQGTFLCPGDVTKTFEKNLIQLMEPYQSEARDNFHKITVSATLEDRKDLLLRLENMNMNRATLFPGLDGLASSLKYRLASPKVLLDPGKVETWD